MSKAEDMVKKDKPRTLPVLSSCGRCFYYAPNNGVMTNSGMSVCTFYPPTALGTQASTSLFPVVDPQNWTCGQFLHV